MLPACMLHEKFQVFGIHIYLQDPKQLLCTPVSNVKQRSTTEDPQYDTPPPPPRTYISAIEDSKSRNINSENYAIEAIDARSSCKILHQSKFLLTFLVSSVFTSLKYVIQR